MIQQLAHSEILYLKRERDMQRTETKEHKLITILECKEFFLSKRHVKKKKRIYINVYTLQKWEAS